jgi:hypothetical protein
MPALMNSGRLSVSPERRSAVCMIITLLAAPSMVSVPAIVLPATKGHVGGHPCIKSLKYWQVEGSQGHVGNKLRSDDAARNDDARRREVQCRRPYRFLNVPAEPDAFHHHEQGCAL